jgi:hypothetical protein
VLAALRHARAETSEPAPSKATPRRAKRTASKAPAVAGDSTAAASASGADNPSVAFSSLSPEDYERPRGRLPALHFRVEPPASHALVLRQLGAPPSSSAGESILDLLAPVHASAGALARSLAAGDAPGLAGDPATAPRRARTRGKGAPAR